MGNFKKWYDKGRNSSKKKVVATKPVDQMKETIAEDTLATIAKVAEMGNQAELELELAKVRAELKIAVGNQGKLIAERATMKSKADGTIRQLRDEKAKSVTKEDAIVVLNQIKEGKNVAARLALIDNAILQLS